MIAMLPSCLAWILFSLVLTKKPYSNVTVNICQFIRLFVFSRHWLAWCFIKSLRCRVKGLIFIFYACEGCVTLKSVVLSSHSYIKSFGEREKSITLFAAPSVKGKLNLPLCLGFGKLFRFLPKPLVFRWWCVNKKALTVNMWKPFKWTADWYASDLRSNELKLYCYSCLKLRSRMWRSPHIKRKVLHI